jgi:enoyl-CoA hydratase/carnithine racemase
MTDLATYSRSGPVGTIVMDDGKANVMSLAMLNALHAAFDQAEKDKTVVILKAGKHFSGGLTSASRRRHRGPIPDVEGGGPPWSRS